MEMVFVGHAQLHRKRRYALADLAAKSGRLTAQGYARLREELDEWK